MKMEMFSDDNLRERLLQLGRELEFAVTKFQS